MKGHSFSVSPAPCTSPQTVLTKFLKSPQTASPRHVNVDRAQVDLSKQGRSVSRKYVYACIYGKLYLCVFLTFIVVTKC
jgi:hypothetical protein